MKKIKIVILCMMLLLMPTLAYAVTYNISGSAHFLDTFIISNVGDTNYNSNIEWVVQDTASSQRHEIITVIHNATTDGYSASDIDNCTIHVKRETGYTNSFPEQGFYCNYTYDTTTITWNIASSFWTDALNCNQTADWEDDWVTDNVWYNFSCTRAMKRSLDEGRDNFTYIIRKKTSGNTDDQHAMYSTDAAAANHPFAIINFQAAAVGDPVITITYPDDNAKLDNDTYKVEINGTVTVSGGSVDSTWINDTRFKNEGTDALFNFQFNGSFTDGERIYITISANNSVGVTKTSSISFYIDQTSPSATSSLDTNNTFFPKNENITFQLNLTDNIQMYSFNITTPEGYLYNISGLDTTKYIYNGSINVSAYSVGEHTITAEYCDAHTKKTIKQWDNLVDKEEMEIRFTFGEDYFSIFPLDKTLIEDVSIEKLDDRYIFHYKKNKNNKQNTQSFIVISNQNIDIIGNQKGFNGWLVINKLKKWIDFNTIFNTEADYHITRINGNMVLVDIDNIETDEFTFYSAGELNCGQKTWKYYLYNYTVDYESEAVAGNDTEIKLIITYADINLDGNGTLEYNSTGYDGNTSKSTIQINITSIVNPKQYSEVTTGLSFFFNYTLNGTDFQTETYNQTIQSIYLAYFGNYTNVSTYNFTLYDEGNNSIINGDISGTFHYLVAGTTSTFNAQLYDTSNLSVEISPPSATTTGDFEIEYIASGYTVRRYAETSAYYSNNTQVIKLYLLQTGSGGYATFQIVDGYSNPLSNVEGSMQKIIGGSLVTVEQQTSDDSGIMTFFVDPDDDYTFTFTKTGYETYTATIRPVTTEVYTIIMESETTAQVVPYGTGIEYFFSPINTVLNNNTEYNFMFNLTSNYRDITSCTLTLKNDTTTLSSSSTSYTTEDCDIMITLNTGNQTKIISQATYILDGETTETVEIIYTVLYNYEGQFSLKNFFDDLTAFSDLGFDDLTRGILAFIIIFIIVGIATYKFASFREPEPLLILIWVLVLFFSYVNWLNLGGIDFPIIRGLGDNWLNQYFIAILTTLYTITQLVRKYI